MKPVFSTKDIIIAALIPSLLLIALVGEAHGFPVFVVPIVVLLVIFFFIRRQYVLLRGVPDIPDPEHKIAVVKGILRKSYLLFFSDFRIKARLMLATAYADKGDYLASFETCEKVWDSLPRNFRAKPSLNDREAAVYADEIIVLIHLGRLKPAESLLSELQRKTFSDSAGRFLSMFSQLYLSVYKADDIPAAREKIEQIRPFLFDEAIHKQFPMRDFRHTLLFLEAKLEMLEKKYSEARSKFEIITLDSINYGNKRLAKEALDYWITRS